jgi:D-apiose dehydrogenase
MKNLQFAVLGTGFWSYFQLSGWKEVGGAAPIACYNRTRSKAEAIAARFNIPHVYDDAEELLDRHAAELDFVDIITDVDTHAPLTLQAAQRGLHVICQKPMSPSLPVCFQMVEACGQAGVQLYIHENFRWQTPLRRLREALDSGVIGRPFKARVTFCSAFPVFDNQPFLAELEQFILTDIGSHILDVCRFLFGEAETLYCQTDRVNPKIRGEDVANVLMRMRNGVSCYAEMSYASLLEREAFPQTLVLIEGEKGSLRLGHDFVLYTTTRTGTTFTACSPPVYDWADPAYAVVHASIVDCNRNLMQDLQRTVFGEAGEGSSRVETTGKDNLETMRLVHAAYDSARTGQVIAF